MPDIYDEISGFMTDHISESSTDDFHLFEPWDVEARPDWMLKQALEDDVMLDSPDNQLLYGVDPHPFQTGFMTCDDTIGVLFAGNRVGKSYCAIIDIIIKATGEMPYAYRYPQGFKTDVKRNISEDNVNRWGRFTLEGTFLDHDFSVEEDGTWDCGYVTGVGHYPKELVIPAKTTKPKVIWVCTKKQAWDEMWWPKFHEVIPSYMLDTSKGVDGFSEKKRHIYLNGGFEIHGLTYDQGAMSFEAVEVPYLFMDEEAPMAVYAAALTHCTKMRIMETPYKGVTWTYDMLLLRSMEADSSIRVFHATMYDSPYVSREWIEERRPNIKRWEVKARVWGFHSDQAGRPYYETHMQTLQRWATHRVNKATYVEFEPLQGFTTYFDLCDQTIGLRSVPTDAERGQWNMYEPVERGEAYWLTADTAEGSEEDEQAAADRNAGFIFRKPNEKENPLFPVMVAACRSTDSTINFARSCAYAAVYYNNALIAPEVRGETGGVFKTELKEYPYMYRMTVINNKTNRPSKKIGFITTSGTRPIIFDGPADYLAEFDKEENSMISYMPLLKELMNCLVGKKGRPDHPRNGTTDSIVAFGIGLYIYAVDNTQIRNNKTTQDELNESKQAWYEGRGVPTKDQKAKAVFRPRR